MTYTEAFLCLVLLLVIVAMGVIDSERPNPPFNEVIIHCRKDAKDFSNPRDCKIKTKDGKRFP